VLRAAGGLDTALPCLKLMAPAVSYVGKAELARIVKICHNVFLVGFIQSHRTAYTAQIHAARQAATAGAGGTRFRLRRTKGACGVVSAIGSERLPKSLNFGNHCKKERNVALHKSNLKNIELGTRASG